MTQENSTIPKEDLVKLINSSFKNIWRCADSNKWDVLKQYDLLTFDWLDNSTNYRNINIKDLPRGMRAIEPWVNKMKKGDLVFIMGKNQYNGIAVINSEYEFQKNIIDMGSNGEKPSVEAKYIHKLDNPINHGLDSHNNPTTFARINQYKFSLNKTIEMLEDKVPEAYNSLVKYFQNKQINSDNYSSKIDKAVNLNQILYGPPGTGKTYQTISKAIDIIDPNFCKKNKNDRTKLTERFKELLISDWSESKGQIAFCTFHQSFTYEDFVEGIKPETHDKKVYYDIEDGVFKRLSDLAKDNWELSKTREVNLQISFDNAFNQLKEEWEEDSNISFPMTREGYDFTILGFTNRSIRFKKASGGTGHTLSIDTLKKGFYDETKIRSTGVGIYYPPIIKRLKSYVSTDNEIKELKPYVLIIDEINRGNVAAIFGELITLLEEDKRAGGDEALSVMLPYSKKEYSVPKNLYIIGTMNTADRSVEALDSALRRRFSFKEVMPNYKVIKNVLKEKNNWNNIQINKILEKINRRIIHLIDRDHQIGHSYFLKLTKAENITYELKNIFSQNIIPLLQEYFFNDSNKLGLVLGEGFLTSIKQENNEDLWAEFNNGDGSDYEDEIYELKDPLKMTDEEFISAIKKLIN